MLAVTSNQSTLHHISEDGILQRTISLMNVTRSPLSSKLALTEVNRISIWGAYKSKKYVVCCTDLLASYIWAASG
jgi:hypothetical protein